MRKRKFKKLGAIGLFTFLIFKSLSLIYVIFKYMFLDVYRLSKWLFNYFHYKNCDFNFWDLKKIINAMTPREFEIFCAELFKANDFLVELTPETADGGKDIIINNEVYVECKHYSETNTVGREIVQKLLGACALDGIAHAVIITTGRYNKNALECVEKAEDKAIQLTLLDMKDILEMVRKTNTKRLPRIMAKVNTNSVKALY